MKDDGGDAGAAAGEADATTGAAGDAEMKDDSKKWAAFSTSIEIWIKQVIFTCRKVKINLENKAKSPEVEIAREEKDEW